MIVEALPLYGTMATSGSANNPTIVAGRRKIGADVADVYDWPPSTSSRVWCRQAPFSPGVEQGAEPLARAVREE
jgi:hypothetical protein